MKNINKILPFIFLIFLSFFAILPLLSPGFFPIHDDTQVARVFEMAKSLSSGMFPVRWVEDLGFGFGYPIFNFYAPFAYYVGGIINLLGVNAMDATKITMILGIILSGLSMYIFSKEFFGKFGGLLSAVLYVYAPYHAVDIYVRGDVAEFYAYAFIPLLFYGLYKISVSKEYKFIVITSISLALIIISHNLTAFMVFPFALIFGIIINYKNKNNLLNVIISMVLGIILSAFYTFPALLEMNYTNVLSQVGGGADFKDHFVCLNQLWTSSWGYGGSVKGCIDGVSFMIGKVHFLLSLLAILLILIYEFKSNFKNHLEEAQKIVLFFLLLGLLSVFLMLDLSKPIWELLKPMAFFQYPWRFLIITVFSLSFVSGFVLFVVKKQVKNKLVVWIISIVLIALVIILNVKFFKSQVILNKVSSDYTSAKTIQWEISKISSEYMPKGFDKPTSKNEVANIKSFNNENVSVLSVKPNPKRVDWEIISNKNSLVTIPVAYFPAWKAYIDGKETIINEGKKGILINVPKGVHLVTLKFNQTIIELVSNLISFAGLLYLSLGIIYSRSKKSKI